MMSLVMVYLDMYVKYTHNKQVLVESLVLVFVKYLVLYLQSTEWSNILL